MSLFARASAGFALSAVERTALRFLKSLWLTALLASLPVLSGLMNALTTNALTVDWGAWGTRLLAAVGTSLAFAVQKYFSAQGDGTPPTTPVASQATSAAIPEPPATNAPVAPTYAPPVPPTMPTVALNTTIATPAPDATGSAT